MDIRKMALALPLAFGVACSTSQSNRTAKTEEPAAPAGTEATREGSPGAAGSDAEGGRVATGPTGTTSGDTTAMAGTSDLKGHASDRVLMGKVESVSSRSLAIQSDMGDSRTLEIVPETIITVDGRDGSFSDIREGQPIRASFNEQDGKQIAVKVEAGEPMGDAGHMGGHGDMGTTGTGSGADTAPHSGTTGTTGTSPADTGTSTSGSATDTGTGR